MKILAVIGSPRKRSNTDLLVDQILEGSKQGKHSSEKLYPVRNSAPLLCSPAIAGSGFIIVPAGFVAPLEFLTGFTCTILKFSLALIAVPAKGEILYVP